MNDADGAMRIAMWSGPRNISTAMMRAWENRGDTAVVDEPFYAFYLHATGLDHPMREEILDNLHTDWRAVVADMTGPVPAHKPVYYQKHMTHHFLAEIDRAWLSRVTNCFLIRHPREVLLSYSKKMPESTPEAVGFPQQREIFDHVCEATGTIPAVLDAADVLRNPEVMLRALCARLGLDFTDRMLNWPPGPRDSDGVWAPHWYDSVVKSTGFAPYTPREGTLGADLTHVFDACLPDYEALYQHRILPADSTA